MAGRRTRCHPDRVDALAQPPPQQQQPALQPEPLQPLPADEQQQPMHDGDTIVHDVSEPQVASVATPAPQATPPQPASQHDAVEIPDDEFLPPVEHDNHIRPLDALGLNDHPHPAVQPARLHEPHAFSKSVFSPGPMLHANENLPQPRPAHVSTVHSAQHANAQPGERIQC